MGGKATGVVSSVALIAANIIPESRNFLKNFGVSCCIRFITVFMIVHFKLNNKNCTTTNRVPYGGR
jgi:hypothetical protein